MFPKIQGQRIRVLKLKSILVFVLLAERKNLNSESYVASKPTIKVVGLKKVLTNKAFDTVASNALHFTMLIQHFQSLKRNSNSRSKLILTSMTQR